MKRSYTFFLLCSIFGSVYGAGQTNDLERHAVNPAASVRTSADQSDEAPVATTAPVSPSPAEFFRLQDLPLEILQLVCEFLPVEDICELLHALAMKNPLTHKVEIPRHYRDLFGFKQVPIGLDRVPQACFPELANVFIPHSEVFSIKTILPRLKSLQKLDLRDNRLGDRDMQALAAVLPHLPNLRVLDLSNNSLGDRDIQALAAVLPHLPNLRALDLTDNRLGSEGAQALAAVLPHLPNLRELDLTDNRLGSEGAQALAAVLPHLPNLRAFY